MSEHRNPQAKLPKPQTHHNPGAPTLVHSHEACTMADLDAIRFEVARADVMADVAKEHFDRTIWREADDARAAFVAHLVSAASEAASAALLAVDDLRRAMASRSTVPSGQIWQDG